MYLPNPRTRFFTFDTPYSAVDWSSFQAVVSAHQKQIEYWYILPCIELLKGSQHYGFSVVALTSLLVDTLSQYHAGTLSSRKQIFKDYLRSMIPETAVAFATPITSTPQNIVDGADALYHGLRCGILHEAHTALYTALVGQSTIIHYHATGYAKYTDGTDCPVVTVAPEHYFNKVNQLATAYWGDLLNCDSSYDQLRQKFKTKFEVSYGVQIKTNP